MDNKNSEKSIRKTKLFKVEFVKLLEDYNSLMSLDIFKKIIY
jgi:hypothetical protein